MTKQRRAIADVSDCRGLALDNRTHCRGHRPTSDLGLTGRRITGGQEIAGSNPASPTKGIPVQGVSARSSQTTAAKFSWSFLGRISCLFGVCDSLRVQGSLVTLRA